MFPDASLSKGFERFCSISSSAKKKPHASFFAPLVLEAMGGAVSTANVKSEAAITVLSDNDENDSPICPLPKKTPMKLSKSLTAPIAALQFPREKASDRLASLLTSSAAGAPALEASPEDLALAAETGFTFDVKTSTFQVWIPFICCQGIPVTVVRIAVGRRWVAALKTYNSNCYSFHPKN